MKTKISLFLLLFLASFLCANLSADASNTLREDDIEGIYMRTLTLYGLSGVYVANVSYLLLKNGDIFEKLLGSPYELDVAESKYSQAKYWYKWKKQGKKIVVKKNSGKEYTWDKWHETVPAKKGETFEGQFQSADAFTGSKIYNFNTMIFNKNGQFAAARVKGGETDWKSISVKSKQSGTYVLDRYSITLKQNGKPDESFLLFFYPDSHQHFVIGRSHFVPLNN